MYFNSNKDCPTFPEMMQHVELVAGGSLKAAELLRNFDVAIHWDGGRHHARSDKASGFCYVNDVVLAIQKLMETYSRVLYIDLDIHHCDGNYFLT